MCVCGGKGGRSTWADTPTTTPGKNIGLVSWASWVASPPLSLCRWASARSEAKACSRRTWAFSNPSVAAQSWDRASFKEKFSDHKVSLEAQTCGGAWQMSAGKDAEDRSRVGVFRASQPRASTQASRRAIKKWAEAPPSCPEGSEGRHHWRRLGPMWVDELRGQLWKAGF